MIEELVSIQQTLRSFVLSLQLVVSERLIDKRLRDGIDLSGADLLLLVVGVTVQVAELMRQDGVGNNGLIIVSDTIGVLAGRDGLYLISESIPSPLFLDAPCHLLHSFII